MNIPNCSILFAVTLWSVIVLLLPVFTQRTFELRRPFEALQYPSAFLSGLLRADVPHVSSFSQRSSSDVSSRSQRSITASNPPDLRPGDGLLSLPLESIRTVASAGNKLLESVILQPSSDGRRRSVVDLFWSYPDQDKKLQEDIGEPGTTHIVMNDSVNEDTLERKYEMSEDPRLRELNVHLSMHGYPPFPFIPTTLLETQSSISNSSSEAITLESLMERIGSSLSIPGSVIAEFSGDRYTSFRESWRLPSTHMPPINDGLSKSAWPTPHRSGYSQGSSELQCVDGTKRLTHNFLNRALITSNPITLFYSADHQFLWGSSWTSIFKVARTQNSLKIIDYVSKPAEKIMADKFHGAYSLLTQENTFIVSTGESLEAYYDVPGSNGAKIMKHPAVFNLREVFADETKQSIKPNEVIRALCMSNDGHIVWVTNAGRVGVLDRDVKRGGFLKVLDWLVLGLAKSASSPSTTHKILTPGGAQEEPERFEEAEVGLDVSNNIACDEMGGVYVVSSKYMHRVDWDGKKLAVQWETIYDDEPSLIGTASGRLGEGSGSTPSIMGSGDNKYVVITDSSKLMNVVVIDAEKGTVAAKHPITFGNKNATDTSSEQSVLVHGWRMVVVNNEPSDSAKQHANFVKMLGMPANAFLRFSGEHVQRIQDTFINAFPVIVGDAPKGVEQFEFDPQGKTIRSTWTNKDLSIPNGIPTMSAHTQLMYGIGKRGSFGGDAAPLRGMWTLEGVDWWTGQSRFYYNIGTGPMSNSIYAATQVGPKEIITGTAAGVVRIYEA